MPDNFLDYIFFNKNEPKLRENTDILLSILKICLKDPKRDISGMERKDSRFNKAKTQFQNQEEYKDVTLDAKNKNANIFKEQDLVKFIREVKRNFFTMERISKINEYMDSEHKQYASKIIKQIGDGKTRSPIKKVTLENLTDDIDEYNSEIYEKSKGKNFVLFLPEVTTVQANGEYKDNIPKKSAQQIIKDIIDTDSEEYDVILDCVENIISSTKPINHDVIYEGLQYINSDFSFKDLGTCITLYKTINAIGDKNIIDNEQKDIFKKLENNPNSNCKTAYEALKKKLDQQIIEPLRIAKAKYINIDWSTENSTKKLAQEMDQLSNDSEYKNFMYIYKKIGTGNVAAYKMSAEGSVSKEFYPVYRCVNCLANKQLIGNRLSEVNATIKFVSEIPELKNSKLLQTLNKLSTVLKG